MNAVAAQITRVVSVIRERSGFVSGVPDSLLRSLPPALTQAHGIRHIVAADEGSAVAMAAGWSLAKARPGVVYMQNSGIGNALNPLLSLMHPDVYSIPVVMMIGYRGGIHDEPQHRPTGAATSELLRIAGVLLVDTSDAPPTSDSPIEWALAKAFDAAVELNRPIAVLVHAGSLDGAHQPPAGPARSMKRLDGARVALRAAPPGAAVVAATGHLAREVDLLRSRGLGRPDLDFLMVGSMGYALSIAVGLAEAMPERPVLCLDGDGAVLMHMGVLTTAAIRAQANLLHVVLNNGSHDSVGGSPTAAATIDLSAVARACGYRSRRVDTESALAIAIREAVPEDSPAFIEVLVECGTVADLPRPSGDPIGRKERFIDALAVE